MKIVHVQTSLNNSSAPYKLHKILKNNGFESEILTLFPTQLSDVNNVHKTFVYRVKRKAADYYRRFISKKYGKKPFFPMDIIPVGIDISKNKKIQAADIIWLHWINGDYQSPKTIEKILKLGKPVIWTCHDNYPFTGGCHVRLGCEKYKKNCGNCPCLQYGSEKDPSYRLIKQKESLRKYSNLYFVSPSCWMDNNLSESKLFKNNKHFIIPNVTDINLFKPFEKNNLRKKYNIPENEKVILIAPKADERVEYNGMEYLWEAVGKYCEIKKDVLVIAFGVKNISNSTVRNFGYIEDQAKLAELYNIADVFLVSSLEDSFNQTVAECMSCGTPVVAFNNSGIVDIIDHKENGYLAIYKDTNDLVEGLKFILEDNLKQNPREKIIEKFSEQIIISKIRTMLSEIST